MFATKLVVVLCLVWKAQSFLDQIDGGDNLQFEASMEQIQDGQDAPATLTCTFKPDDHPDVSKLLSLKLLKKSGEAEDAQYVELVTLTEKGLRDTDEFLGAATGNIVNGSDSVLEVEFVQPSQDDVAGDYKCQAAGLDDFNAVVGSESVLSIQAAPVEDIVKVMTCMEGEARPNLTAAEAALIKCGASEDDWFQMLRKITARQMSQETIIYGVSEVFNSSSFYIFTSAKGMDFATANTTCQTNNGYFAEINTEEEYDFMEQALKTLSQTIEVQPFRYLMTGVEYNGSEFLSVHRPEDPVYLGFWLPGEEPSTTGETQEMFLLLKSSDEGIGMLLGGPRRTENLGFICEVNIEDIDDEAAADADGDDGDGGDEDKDGDGEHGHKDGDDDDDDDHHNHHNHHDHHDCHGKYDDDDDDDYDRYDYYKNRDRYGHSHGHHHG